MQCGIYVITNTLNNKKYIGSSCNLKKRWTKHLYLLRKNSHDNPYFQNAWNFQRGKGFIFEIIENCSKEHLLIREGWWIEHLQCFRREIGYNLCRFPRASRLGCKASPETLRRMSIANGGKNHPNWGKKLSASHVRNIRKSQVGIPKPNSGVKKFFKIVNPNGLVMDIKGLRAFCRDNNLCHSMIWRVLSGKQEEYRGWKKYLDNSSNKV